MDREALKTGIVALLTDMESRDSESKEEYASRLSELIEAFVKSAKIKYNNGLVAPNGAVTGVFNGYLT